MKNARPRLRSAALAAGLGLSALVCGCGGAEPLSSFSGSGATPQLTLPVANPALITTILPFSASGVTTARDGFDIQLNTAGQQVIAPGPGVISYVDSTAGASIVYVYHNVHLLSRISQMQSTSAVAGQVVAAGSPIGSSSALNAPVHFSTYFDNGAAVCPLSFLTPTDQSRVAVRDNNIVPCQ